MPHPPGPSLPAAWPRPSQVPARSLAEVAAHLGLDVPGTPGGSPDARVVTGVSLDSRSVLPGDLYAAPAGARAHGADFAGAASAAGAVGCVTDAAGAQRSLHAGLPTFVVASPRAVLGGLAAWVYGDPAEAMTMLGITGTNGKTTTAYLLEAGLRAAGRRTGVVGTIETRIGDEVLPSERTTPEAPDLQALLAVMRERGTDAVAMEVSSHALAMGRVDGTTYDVALFTNLSEDHLDFHADLEDYFQVKASLFTPERSRRAVVDVDDEHGRRLVGLATVPVTTVSTFGVDADWRVEKVDVGPLGSTFVLAGPDGARLDCGTRLAGDFNVANAALAVVALGEAGVDLATAVAGVAACPGVPGRMERVAAGDDGPLALVDFAHTPDALTQLLAAARALVPDGGRLLVVLGCGGDRDTQKRPVMGGIAVRDADVVVLTSDNPRTEDPAAIVEDIRRGADAAQRDGATGRLEVEVDRRAAIRLAAAAAGPGDVLVVAGKGHEQGQEIAGVRQPFDDRVELAAALREVRA
ncbi:MAG: UDP-N-acetylmuramoyl-L-alanyl-D-glutamate--2,6-diaminopimelate ligase [Sporichthyaceae bacterium]